MKVKYTSNNSGGRWWLGDEDWKALESAGWAVEWVATDPFYKDCGIPDGRRLGALAKSASKDFETPGDAMREFERITGQSVSDEGCNCCGAPHTFYWGCAAVDDCGCPAGRPHKNYEWASGEGCLQYLYPSVEPMTLRDAYEKARGGSR